ncbi:hypothetical protein C8R43DRAFT_905027, partial [Mycena crocata]
DENRAPVLDWISSMNVFDKHSDVLRSLQPGTGQWLVETDAFKTWLCGSGRSLWLPGIPGAGKTVLVSLVIDHLRNIQRKQSTRIGLAWVYYNYKEESRQTPDAVFFSIARQLAASSVDLYEQFKLLYHKNPYTRASPDEILSDDFLLRGFKQTFLVFDALDECAEENRDAFLKMIVRLQNFGANIAITG